MALGIKKITESVIEDNRSLIMLGSYSASNDVISYSDNQAIPDGAIISSNNSSVNESATLRVKLSDKKQIKINAHTSLTPKTIKETEIDDSAIITRTIKNKNITEGKMADNSISTRTIINKNITEEKMANSSISTRTVKDKNITEIKMADNSISTRTVKDKNITEIKMADNSISTRTVKNGNITYAKLGTDVQKKFTEINTRIDELEQDLLDFKSEITASLNTVKNDLIKKINDLNSSLTTKINKVVTDYNLKNVVLHNGSYDVLGAKVNGKYTSTPLSDIKCTGNINCSGDIHGNRVYYMTYQDLAEGYIPGEDLDKGDIVAIHEDGKVYLANSINDCIVGVISEDFANCFGATKAELFEGTKVAVGMIGKVSVKVKGPVKIGQQITVSLSEPGIGCATNSRGIGQALHSIECDFDEINEVLVQIRPM